jgi:hypothetical protein
MEKVNIRDIPLQVVEGVASKTYKADWSIKIPNELTEMKERAVMGGADGYHPTYSVALEEYLYDQGVTIFDTGADYPVNDNTLRMYFDRLDDAHVALFFIKRYEKNHKLWNELSS